MSQEGERVLPVRAGPAVGGTAGLVGPMDKDGPAGRGTGVRPIRPVAG